MTKSKWAIAFVGVLASGVLSVGAAHATGSCSDSSVDLRSSPVGFKCHTSKGSIFERVAKDGFGEAWKGPDGLIWSDFIGRFTNDGIDKNGLVIDSEATRQCARIGGMLPSSADYERGEANGFREVIPNMLDKWYWSSSVHPNSSDFAHTYYGLLFDGFKDFYYRVDRVSVRCIGQ